MCVEAQSYLSVSFSFLVTCSLFMKEWIPMAGGNQAGFHGLAEFSQAKLSKANKAFGEEIARLQVILSSIVICLLSFIIAVMYNEAIVLTVYIYYRPKSSNNL